MQGGAILYVVGFGFSARLLGWTEDQLKTGNLVATDTERARLASVP
jgi:hypothetical protein